MGFPLITVGRIGTRSTYLSIYQHNQPEQGTLNPPSTRAPSRFRSHRHNHVALLVPFLDIPVGLGDLLQRIATVDDRPERPRFRELPQEIEVALARLPRGLRRRSDVRTEALQLFEEAASEQSREDSDREEEPWLTGHPPVRIGREATAGHDAMHMRMMGQGRSPGVQHERRADPDAQPYANAKLIGPAKLSERADMMALAKKLYP